jgi:putative ABC transport system permease protein
MQKAVVAALPNVSIIDLALVLDTIDAVVRKVSFVIRFMALFTVVTGLIVLAASILTGRYQRVRETILLRTLGASRQQVHRILIAEYFLTGLLSSLTGVVLAEAAAWGLCRFVFAVQFTPAIFPALVALLIVTLTTVVIGLVANRGVLNRPPLQVLQ